MSLFWTPPTRVLATTRKIDLAIRQNHHLLQIAGEPTYLIRRIQVADRKERTGTEMDFEFDTDLGLWFFDLWDPSIELFPDSRYVTILVDGEAWRQAFDKFNMGAGAKEYAIEVWRNKTDSDGNPLDDRVICWLNTPPFSGPYQRVDFTYKMICRCVDIRTMQPSRPDCPYCNRSLYGFDQYLNPRARWRGKLLPHTFPLAFPDVTRDLIELSDAGFKRVSDVDHWTSPPPLCPLVREHDYIQRVKNGRRYEVDSFAEIKIGAKLVQQQFKVVEIDPSDPVMNIAIKDN